MSTPSSRIAALREEMKQHNLSAYIIPGTDPHASEYMADHWKETTWISGFKGETGTVLITTDRAFLWTDSRYYLQADKELEGSGVELMKESEIDTPTIPQWLCENLAQGQIVGLNPEMFTVKGYAALSEQLAQKELTIKSVDLIRPLWTENRPPIPQSTLYEYEVKYAGETTQSKINRIRQELKKKSADTMVISALDEIAWLFNIRGFDVDFNPVVISYALIQPNSCTLFVDPQKIDHKAQAYLNATGITARPYEEIFAALRELPDTARVLFDGSRLNRALWEALPVNCKKIDTQSPVLLLKSMKNEVEIEGEKKAMIQDAVALTRFFRWLDTEAFANNRTQTEYSLMEKLHELRAQGNNFVEESFGTIAGYQGNGAIVHYEATKDDCAVVEPYGVLLLDSGGQYLDGTTDITRTVWLGEIPEEGTEQREFFNKVQHDNTLVMKGHIALACAKFPRGTRGNQLDVLAHQYMWKEGITYGHGTGHGVGHFLGCHEGPQNIRTDNNPAPLYPGNICSDEPGIYRAGEYGIRIENLITVVEDSTTEFGTYYRFDTLTLCFYDLRLLDMNMLTEQEKEWIRQYHQNMFLTIEPLLSKDEASWLKARL